MFKNKNVILQLNLMLKQKFKSMLFKFTLGH